MRIMKPILALLLMVSMVGYWRVSVADTTITQITSNSYEDRFPWIKDDYVVWQGFVGDDWEIFLYDIAAGETLQITNNDYDDLSPRSDGRYTVWQGFDDGEWDIFLWDGTQIQAISDRSAEDTCPEIANGFVVWTSQPFGDDFVGLSEVILYDAGTHTSMVLSAAADPDNALDDTAPRINDEVVIWIQDYSQCNATLYMYDLSSATITENPDYVWRDSPQRDGNLRVFTRHDGQDREILLYNSKSMRYHQITDNSVEDRSPIISGNHVAWMADGEIFLAEFQYLTLIGPKDNAVLPKRPLPTFRWEGIGYDGFNIEFSVDEDFLTGNALTSSRGRVTSLSEASFTPTEEEWDELGRVASTNGRVYWRVEGAGSGEDLSETRSFMIEGESGSVPVNGVVETDSASDDSGPCFIGTVAH